MNQEFQLHPLNSPRAGDIGLLLTNFIKELVGEGWKENAASYGTVGLSNVGMLGRLQDHISIDHCT